MNIGYVQLVGTEKLFPVHLQQNGDVEIVFSESKETMKYASVAELKEKLPPELQFDPLSPRRTETVKTESAIARRIREALNNEQR